MNYNNILQRNLEAAMKRLQPFSTMEIFIGSLHITEIYLITKLELKGKSGIYGFLCKTTGKLYIGSSINLSSRFCDHIKGIQSNVKLQNAINKYNLHDFIFIVFEYCEAENLITREQIYLDSLQPEFNILKTAGSSLGFKHTEDSKTRMSKAQKNIDRLGVNNPRGMLDKSHSEKTKTLISLSMSGRRVSK